MGTAHRVARRSPRPIRVPHQGLGDSGSSGGGDGLRAVRPREGADRGEAGKAPADFKPKPEMPLTPAAQIAVRHSERWLTETSTPTPRIAPPLVPNMNCAAVANGLSVMDDCGSNETITHCVIVYTIVQTISATNNANG